MAADPIDRVEKISSSTKKLQKIQPEEGVFEALMQKNVETAQKPEAVVDSLTPEEKRASLFDEVAKLSEEVDGLKSQEPSRREILRISSDVIAQIEEAKSKLETPGLELPRERQTLLKAKLNHIDDSLQVMMKNAGVEYVPPTGDMKGLAEPVHRFIGLLTKGQHQLDNLTTHIRALHEKKEDLSPATMLLMQVKVQRIQQSVELFTAMLNKMLESIKATLNTQV